MMKLKKGSYKRDEREVGNGCNVYAKEMKGRLETDVMEKQLIKENEERQKLLKTN